MPWILSAINESNFNCFLRQAKSFDEKQKDFDIRVNIFNQNDFVIDNKQGIDISFLKECAGVENQLKNLLNFKFEKPSNIAIKNTVSSML